MDFFSLLLMAGGLTLLKKKKVYQNLEYEAKSLSYDKKANKLYLNMDIINPTGGTLKVDSMFLSILVNDRKTGRIERSEPFTITKAGRTPVKLPITISPSGLGEMIADVIKGKKLNIKVVGLVRSMGIDTAIEEKVDLNL